MQLDLFDDKKNAKISNDIGMEKMVKKTLKAISLFSCIGVAEYYLKSIGIDVLVASDIDKKRCDVHKFLYPDTTMVCGDIRTDETKQVILDKVKDTKIDLVIATPPCQGMSSVGKNRSYSKLISQKDDRNFLILESFKIIDSLQPKFILFENVPRILKVLIPYKGKALTIIDILKEKYGNEYDICAEVFNCANYGVPQSRERCFIRLSKKGLKWPTPKRDSHVITLREAIGDLPSLEAGESSSLKNHWARIHPKSQVEWLKHTPTGCSALDNARFFPKKSNGERVKAYGNCYKRMTWDAPSPTVTMRNEIMSSQDKVHPGRDLGNGLWSDARVLTLRELLIVMSLPPDLNLPTFVSDTALRQYIGEGIPSLMMKKMMEGICPKQK